MKRNLWMSAAASIALLAAATGCNAANTAGNAAGDVARTAGRTAGNAAGMAGDAVQRGANTLGNATGQGLNAVGRGVQRGANAVGNATGLNNLGDQARQGINRAGDAGAPGNAWNTPGVVNRNGVSTMPSLEVNHGTRIVTLRFSNTAAATSGWRTARTVTNAPNQNLNLTLPTGWTLRVNNTDPSYNHVSVGIVPYAAAVSPANGIMTSSMTITTPGRYHIVAQSPGMPRHVIGTVSVLPGSPSVRLSIGPTA